MNNANKPNKPDINAKDIVLTNDLISAITAAVLAALSERKTPTGVDAEIDVEIDDDSAPHPYLGKRVLVRTYSAGVHAGTLSYVSEDWHRVRLTGGCFRVWSWDGTKRLSLSSISGEGIEAGKTDECEEICLTEVIEILPLTAQAENTLRDNLYKK